MDYTQILLITTLSVTTLFLILVGINIIFVLIELRKVLKKINSIAEGFEKLGLEIAEKVYGKTPVVWANQMYKHLARVWTIKFNEHAKNPSFWNFFY